MPIAITGRPCAAQTADVATTGDNGALQEVTVSATRQGEQSLQTVPMSISVVSPTDLDQKGLAGVTDFVRTLPSANMQAQSPGVTSIEMRGLVTTFPDITTLQDRSLTSTYLDDAPISIQSANPDLKVFDLERVEVIRGPQGTLYGAGSMAGTIRLITRKPDSHEFSGSSDVSLSSTEHGGDNYSVRGMVNLPLITDRLAVRIAGYRDHNSGFIDNLGLNKPDANDDGSTQGRIAVRWTPSDSLTIDGSVTFARLIAHGDYDIYPSLGKYTYESLQPERFDDYFKLYNLTVDEQLPFAHLVVSTSYQDRAFTDARSFDFFDEALATPGTLLPATGYQINTVKDATEEARLISSADSPLRWTVGAFHEYYHRFYPQIVTEPGFDAAAAQLYGIPGFSSVGLYGTPQPDQFFWGTIDVKEYQTALFGELTYALTPKLKATVGARYFDFRQNFDLYFTGFAGALGPHDPLITNGETTAKGANPRFVASYDVSDSLMVYGQAARGFRYGGVNLPVPLSFCATDLAAAGLKNAPPTFGPDNLWDYEVGEKGSMAGGRVTLNTTAYYILWNNVQTTFPLACGYPFVENRGKVKSQGLELETHARITNGLTASLSGSYTDAAADGPLDNLGAPSGSRVPYFPRTIVTLGGDYVIPAGSGTVRWSADYTYRSSANTQFNTANPLDRLIPSSVMLNGSITYAIRTWEVALYGTNLTNNLLISTISPDNRTVPYQPDDMVYVGRPRTIGIRIHYGF